MNFWSVLSVISALVFIGVADYLLNAAILAIKTLKGF